MLTVCGYSSYWKVRLFRPQRAPSDTLRRIQQTLSRSKQHWKMYNHHSRAEAPQNLSGTNCGIICRLTTVLRFRNGNCCAHATFRNLPIFRYKRCCTVSTVLSGEMASACARSLTASRVGVAFRAPCSRSLSAVTPAGSTATESAYAGAPRPVANPWTKFVQSTFFLSFSCVWHPFDGMQIGCQCVD